MHLLGIKGKPEAFLLLLSKFSDEHTSESLDTDHRTSVCCGMFQEPKVQECCFFKDMREVSLIKGEVLVSHSK